MSNVIENQTIADFNCRLHSLRQHFGGLERHETSMSVWVTPWNSEKVLMVYDKNLKELTIY